ncbi:MAG: pantetheine-phosphate adenylyltransferase, partial [Planctomycetota bacterium]
MARAAAICDALVVGVGCNPAKQPLLDPQRRVELLTRCCENQPTVRVIAYTGSTVAAAHAHGATLLVRGLRHGRDADHEYPTAECNRRAGLESIALFARPEHAFISASLVRELLAAGHDLEPYLPPAVAAAL